jgi:uncharacterized membrane protein YvlD (DUF360 family)
LKRQIWRVILTWLALYYIFPLIPGIEVHGSLGHIFIAGLAFGFFAWLVEFMAITLSTIFAIGTLGLGLLLLIPIWMFGFWLVPAITLRLLAHFLPSYLTIAGWGPAILGGLVMLLIGLVTGGRPDRYWR